MLKKAKNRLLTRAAQDRECVFAGVYRAATVRKSVTDGLFQQPFRDAARYKLARERKIAKSTLALADKPSKGGRVYPPGCKENVRSHF
jgi:hypothetical protein